MPANRNGPTASKITATKRGRRAATNPVCPIPPSCLPSTRVNRGQNRRLNANDDQQTNADNTRAARLAKAQEEKTRLHDEVEKAAQENEELQQEAELIATLARVTQFKVQKAEREARQETTITTTGPIIGGVQSAQAITGSVSWTGGSQLQNTFGSALQQGESSLVSVELFE